MKRDWLKSDISLDGQKAVQHYGTPRHSGRYPWGSGENPYQRQKDFYSHVNKLKAQGLSQVEIAKGMNMSTTQLRAKMSNAKIEMRAAETAELRRLVDKGYSLNAAAKRMGIPEATARIRLSESSQKRADAAEALANTLKDQVEQKGYLDVGKGTEQYLNVSSTKLNNTLALLKEQGYSLHTVQFEQVGTGEKTTMKVLTKGDVPWKEVNEHKFDIMPVADVYLEGDDWRKVEPPRPIDVSTVQVNYTVDGKGGVEKDGLIEIRPGIPELSLGKAAYAQVRIAVDDGDPDNPHHGYMKGMAVYANDLPEGVNVRYNSNKAPGTPLFENPDPMGETIFKKIKDDPENPFGATIKDDTGPEPDLKLVQRHYKDANGNEQLSAINVVNEQGNWEQWSRTLSAQMLSKQSPALAKKQLAEAYRQKEEEFNEIMSLTNPTLKKYLLEKFADECDSSAVHMKAAALPGTASHVLIPFPGMKENEIYAPGYPEGSRVVLIRYPHGGTFEIPELIVNNHYPKAKETLGNAPDAVGIHPKAAKQLSGADFDGDTALVIPNDNHAIKSRRAEDLSPSLRSVRDFDPSAAYPGYEGMKVIKPRTKQTEMGKVTNLIADMTLKGATDDEIARAVRHSMVIIDAEKHKLNYKQSYIDNGIAELKAKYQGVNDQGGLKGASTIITKAKSETRIGTRKEGQWVTDPETGKAHRLFYDPNTGAKLFEDKHETWVDRKGKMHERQEKVPLMSITDDAYKLTSGGSKENPGKPMEAVYADHANRLKALANRARLISTRTSDIEYNPSARQAYAAEVLSLRSKLNQALRNAPLERKAQLLANKVIQAKKEANPNMEADKLKKVKGQALRNARRRVNPNSKDHKINITDREWKAIQSGAVHKGFLRTILGNTDLDKIKAKAMPRTASLMSSAKTARARAMLRNGHSQAAVAEALGVSVSTLMRSVSGDD